MNNSRQQIEIMKGLKNKETAERSCRREGKMKNLKMGSGSTVCSEASTGVGLGASGNNSWTMHACAHSLAVLSIQETKSWMSRIWNCLDYVCYGSKPGFATLLVSEQFLHN